MIDFSSYVDDKPSGKKESKVRHLPVEAKGSNLWVRIELDPEPKFPAIRFPGLSVTKGGLVQIPLVLTVESGKFEGRRFYTSLFAPEQFQHVNMSDGQKKACAIASILMRRLLLSGAGFGSRDTSPEAKQAASLNSWQDLNGKRALVKIGEFNKHPQIDAAICSDSEDYAKGEQLSESARAWEWSPSVQMSPTAKAIQDTFGPFDQDDVCPF